MCAMMWIELFEKEKSLHNILLLEKNQEINQLKQQYEFLQQMMKNSMHFHKQSEQIEPSDNSSREPQDLVPQESEIALQRSHSSVIHPHWKMLTESILRPDKS